MASSVQVGEHVVAKRFDHSDQAFKAVARTEFLRSAVDNLTPAARIDPMDPAVVMFDRVHGEALKPGVIPSPDGMVQHDLEQLLACLVTLHGCPLLPGAPRSNPLIRIEPRLTAADRHSYANVLNLADKLMREFEATCMVQLHGDVHAGQFIRDRRGHVWLLDLDDMAVGPPEADLGNLVANLSTQRAMPGQPVAVQYRRWRTIISLAYQAVGCRQLNAVRLDRYGRLAALRRLLKLRERRDHQVVSQLHDWLTDDAGHNVM